MTKENKKKKWTDLTPTEMTEALKQMGTERKIPTHIDETKYPMRFKEFEKEFREKIIKDCTKQYHLSRETVENDLENYLKKYPQITWEVYVSCCEALDESKAHYDTAEEYKGTKRYNNHPLSPPSTAFRTHMNYLIFQIEDELYFF